jgi:hypothetical protein
LLVPFPPPAHPVASNIVIMTLRPIRAFMFVASFG